MSTKITRREFLIKTLAVSAGVAIIPGLTQVAVIGKNRRQSTPISDFSFIHISDEHVHHSGTPETIRELASLKEVTLSPYKTIARPPSFVIETGDLTEFGPWEGAWEALDEMYEQVPLERYMALGNHDETWRSLCYEMRKLYGAPYYSFDKHGCHFVVLNSAGLQDPKPILSPEEISWLETDLAKIGMDVPMFLALHHPLDCGEYSSRYEVYRLMDILRPYNVAAILVGHSHLVKYDHYDGFDMVHGGSSWGPCTPGYNVVSVTDKNLRIAYKPRGEAEATIPMVSKPLFSDSKYPDIAILSPDKGHSFRNVVPLLASCKPSEGDIKRAYAEIDGSANVDLVLSEGAYEADLNISEMKPGAHYIRMCFVGNDDTLYHRSSHFYVESDQPNVRWRALTKSASKCTPAVSPGLVVVGTNNCTVNAYNRSGGELVWSFHTNGAVTAEPIFVNDNVCFGSDDRWFYCVSAVNGELVWKYPAGEPIYSGAVSDGNLVYFGRAGGGFVALDAVNGKVKWKVIHSKYNIESKPVLMNGRIYYGCWDTNVYCISAEDGSLIWKCMGQGSSEGKAPRYYSPADCGPVVTAGKVFIADRKYRMSVIDAESGDLHSYWDGVSAVGVSENKQYIYLRMLDKQLIKIDTEGKTVWAVNVGVDESPAAPQEVSGMVYVSSKRGLVSAVSAADGSVMWRYQATPQAYVLACVSGYEDTAYVMGTDGTLTAISN